MTPSFSYEPLTPSGRGAKVRDRSLLDFAPEELRALVERYRFIAFQDHPLTTEQVREYLGKFGPLTQNDRRKDGVLALDGKKKDEVLLGEGFMPLHKDGALMGTDVALIGIHAIDVKHVTSGGRTFVMDLEGATEEVPKEYLDLLRDKGIEGRPVDSYYLKSSDTWHRIPGFVEFQGKSFLNVGFPYSEGQKPSWLVRIPGETDARTTEVFDAMRKIFMSPRYCYFHAWTEGEVLLIDNKRTLHGREEFQGQRSLANIQVLAA